ncbi:unnamed protein product [Rotaria sp. Silwood2]|nr:unnamed protein product [Rotaria sp. Silwood2]
MGRKGRKQENNENQALLNDKKISHDTDDQHRQQSSRLEQAESSWFRLLHVLFWSWVIPILRLGYKRQLTANDLDNAPHVDKASVLLNRLRSYDWSSSTTWMIIRKEFWKDYMFASLIWFPFLIINIGQLLLFCQLIWNMMDKQLSTTVTYLCVVSLFVSVVIESITQRLVLFRSTRIGMRIRNALIIKIYAHSLYLKSTSSEQTNTGQIINLIANDTSKIEEVFIYLAGLCEGILEAIVMLGLLCWIIHPIPALCGYAISPLFILIQVYFSRKFSQYRETTAMCSDKRIQAFSEFIYGCHAVKMYNWEKPIKDHIVEMREKELASIRWASRFRALNITQFFISTQCLALTTFGSALIFGYPLSTANTLPALAVFGVMRYNIMYKMPTGIEKLSEARPATKRIDAFLRLTVQQEHQSSLSKPSSDEQQKESIIMSNASFSWQSEIPCLSSLDLTIEQRTLVGIVGPVGSGKSSLLAAILGEMNLINGRFNSNNTSFSYAAQSPWIFADTFRNNILLNRLFHKERYRHVIHACCLDVDLYRFGSHGDLTVIGENGVNLSGGQKARIGLARALYADADIYLLDDPFSAVDRAVAKQIYGRCIGPHGLLKNKTRLLVTHQPEFLHEAHQVIFLSHGHINKEGCLDECIVRKDDTNKNETPLLASMLDNNTSMTDVPSIISDETPLNDGTNWSVWYHLLTAPPAGIFGLCLLIVLLLLGEVLNDSTNYCLSIWLKQKEREQQLSHNFAYTYFTLIIATIIADIIRTNYYFTVILNGSNSLHNNMLRGLLYTSLQFFESNPSGRILNRVSKDQHIMDDTLLRTFLMGIVVLLMAAGSIFIICFTSPPIFLLLIILIPIVWFLIHFYQRSFRQLKRLESITRSPVYASFSTSLNGLSTIRAFKAENSFIQLTADRMDVNTSAYIIVEAASQWFTFMLTVACSLILLVTSVYIIFFQNRIDPPAGALSLMSAMFVSNAFQWSVRKFSEIDILMTSGERIDEYSHLPREENEGDYKRYVKTSPNWPTHGTVEFRNYSLRHRVNLPYAIQNINLRIESGQKIGIIGRTGAGKSSLFKGICRFVHQSNVDGAILIDNVDISCITLGHLRSHLTVIPQQAVLFSGTLRYYLDPFDSYSDEQCWKALEDVQLKQFVSNHSAGLRMLIAESGNNLSVGQCQLINLARAILKKSKILLIDEATANVDKKTDDIIQEIINNKFQDRTVITIAHRLNTVANCDHILVLDNGMLVNYDTSVNILSSYQ